MSSDGVLIPPDLRLEPASAARLQEYLAMIDTAVELGETGDGYTFTPTAAARSDPAGHLRRLAEMERGIGLPDGWVPMSTRWLIAGSSAGRVAGEARIRHALSPSLEIEGGHVGYFIHPELRSRGYGRSILAMALRELAVLRVSRVLVTCNADNLRSRRVIEGNGGVFDRYTVSPRSGKQVMRYWVPNSAPE